MVPPRRLRRGAADLSRSQRLPALRARLRPAHALRPAGRRRRHLTASAAIWSLCVSFGDLVTHILDIENVGDQIAPPAQGIALLSSPTAFRAVRACPAAPVTDGPGNLDERPRCLRRPTAGCGWPDASAGPVEQRRSAARSANDPTAGGAHRMDEPIPVTGAWRPGDDVGHRRFFTFATDRRFALDGGVTLRDVTVAYETWGTLERRRVERGAAVPRVDRRQPRHAARPAAATRRRAGGTAWSGPGLAIDTDRWFVVCANVLGGCQGSTGPASPHPVDGRPYGSHGSRWSRSATWCAPRPGWPTTSAIAAWHTRDRRLDGRDAGARVGDHLSRSGALDRARSPRACRRRRSRSPGERSAGGRSGLDPKLARRRLLRRRRRATARAEGLSIARMVAQVTFRSDNVFTDRFGRELADGRRSATASTCGSSSRSSATSTTTATSWSAGSTPTATSIIGKAMDLHDVGPGRGGLEAAMARITVPAPDDRDLQRHALPELPAAPDRASCWRRTARRASYIEIDSPHGHDAFLINLDQLVGPLADFLEHRKLP